LHKKHYLLLIVVILTALATAGSALAERAPGIEYKADYDVKGKVDFERVSGHQCHTGAQKTQTIEGYGNFTKSDEITISRNVIIHKDRTDWEVPPDAIDGLIVTTVIDLCARPISEVAQDYAPADLVYSFVEKGVDPEVAAEYVYETYGFEEGEIINPYHPLVVDGTLKIDPKTEQVWASQMETVPGHSGAYHEDFRAAYGPGPYEEAGIGFGNDNHLPFDEDEFMWWFDEKSDEQVTGLRWWDDETRRKGIDYGDRYVGNYFDIDQYAMTTSGEMRRLISISEPFENRFLEEAYRVEGMSEVKEVFSVEVLPPGPDAFPLEWYKLF